MRVLGNESLRRLSVYFGSLVHDSACVDALTVARHQSFIAYRLLGGLLALCVFPIYLVVEGKPSLLGAVAFLWLLSPIAIAIFLSRTGRFAAAHLISAINFAGLVTYCAWLTGGLASGLLPWLVAVPFEAGLATDRRIVIGAGAASLLGLAALAVLGVAGLTPSPFLPLQPYLFALLGAASAVAYAAGLGIMSQVVHRHSEHVIHKSEERYRLIAENANDMITSHDAKGRVVFASLAAQHMLGEPVQRVLGDGLSERVHVADRPAYLTALSRCLAGNETIAVEFRVRRAGARECAQYAWVEMRCRPIPSIDNGVERAGIVAVTRDITDHKAQEAQLRKARDEAESASRAKTHFLASMSHELRTPLNAIIGFSEILNQELFGALGEARYRDYARMIHESGEHLLNVVNDILDMSKIEAGKFEIVREPFDVAKLLESCCDVVRHMAEKKSIDLKVEGVADLPELSADKRACKQMLLNVISNAIKFTEPGGWVKVSAHKRDGSIVFAVSDNGIGIAEQDLPRLCNPFVQANDSYDRNHAGTGLGLSVVRGLARLHGGALKLTSALGEGTTATITLPIRAKTEAKPVELPRASAA